MLYSDAVASKVKVVCTYYKPVNVRSKRDYVFTYDGPVDTTAYLLENALGLVELELPDGRGRYALRDTAQGPRLDAALQLTKPSMKPGSKRTRGEEVEAAETARQRQEYRPEDLGLRPPSKEARKAPTVRVRR